MNDKVLYIESCYSDWDLRTGLWIKLSVIEDDKLVLVKELCSVPYELSEMTSLVYSMLSEYHRLMTRYLNDNFKLKFINYGDNLYYYRKSKNINTKLIEHLKVNTDNV